MKQKLIIIIASLLLPSVSVTTAFASEKLIKTPSIEEEMSEQKEVLKKYNKGETFTQGGTKYTVYPQLYANLKKLKTEEHGSSLQNNSNLVLTMKNFSVYKVLENASEKKQNYNNQIVYNDSTENFGILSGVIIVKTKNNSEFKEKSFEVVKSYPNLGYFLVKIPKNITIQVTLERLKKLDYVTEANVEVIENFKDTL